MPEDLPVARPEGEGSVDSVRAYPSDSGHRANGEGRKGGEEEEGDLRLVVDAEPNDENGVVGQRREGPIELDDRVEKASNDTVVPHSETDRDGGYQSQCETEKYPKEARS